MSPFELFEFNDRKSLSFLQKPHQTSEFLNPNSDGTSRAGHHLLRVLGTDSPTLHTQDILDSCKGPPGAEDIPGLCLLLQAKLEMPSWRYVGWP